MAEANVDDISDDEGDSIINGLDESADDEFESFRYNSSTYLGRSQSDAELRHSDIPDILGSATSMDRFDDEAPLSGNRISESSRVFFDLSKIDSEMDSTSISTAASACSMKDVRFKLRLNQSLETIPQNEILVTKQTKVSYSTMSSRTYSSDTLDDIEESDDSMEQEAAAEHLELHHSESNGSFYSKYPLNINQSPGSDNHAVWQNKQNLKLKYQQICANLEKDISDLKRATGVDEVKPLQHIYDAMVDAWDYKVYGRDLAYGLCDIIRNESVLSLLIRNCECDTKDVLVSSAALLEQVMSLRNRERISHEGLEAVVRMTQRSIGDHDLANSSTGILENLFKVSEEVSTKVIQAGGLDAVLYWSRCKDVNVLRKCAKALSNLSLFGGPENQEIMTQQKVPEWLFPLAFMDDKHIKYYACLSVAVLVANKELEAQVLKSGTLDLVIPFVSTEKPEQFALSDYAHRQGRDPEWLKRLKPLLCSRRPEAQALAAFHFAMEAGIKSAQGKNNVSQSLFLVF